MGATILFADGSPEVRSEAVLALEGTDCGVVPVSNGREALWMLTRQTPDMVVAEVDLPGIDGIALAWHIRAWLPDVPIVLMSREFGEADLAQLRPLYNLLLPKPLSPARLRDVALELSGQVAGRSPTGRAHGAG